MAIGLIGNFTKLEPPKKQLHEVNALITESIRRQKVHSNYKLFGSRLNEHDGAKMFKSLKKHKRWTGFV